MKDRITISIERKAISLADSMVGKSNIQNRSQAIEAAIFSHFSGAGQTKAIILAGKKPSHEGIMETLKNLESFGITDLIVAGGKHNEALFSLINSHAKLSEKATFLKEEKDVGTAGIVKSAENLLQGTFLVIFGDINCNLDLRELLEAHTTSRKVATMAVTMPKNKAEKVDNIRVSGNTITSFEYNAKKPTNLQNAGIIAFEQEALDLFPTHGSMEQEVLPLLAAQGKLGLFLFDTSWKHKG